MPTEKGVVTKVDSTTAWVITNKTSACEGCVAKGSCHALGGGTEMEVEAINRADAKVGQKVVISFDTSPLLKATFMLYVLPILCLLVGAFVGEILAPVLGVDSSVSSVIIGFTFLGLAIMAVKIKGNRMAKRDEYRPKVIRVIG